MKESTLSILDIHGNPIPNTYSIRNANNHRLAITFPGLGYLSQAPLLFYLKELLSLLDHDVLSIEYTYCNDNAFLGSTASERDVWFSNDITSIHKKLLDNNHYTEIVLAGKSLGTTAILKILRMGLPQKQLKCIWLTPGASHSEIIDFVKEHKVNSLFIVGTEDRFYNRLEYENLLNIPNIKIKLFQLAGHSLEIENNIDESIMNVKECMADIRNFIEKG